MLYAVSGVILIIILFFVTIAAATSHMINRSVKRGYLDAYFVTPWELKIPFESVVFQTADGISLRGWWLSRPGRRVIVGCPGLNGSKSDLIGIGPYLWRSGFNVLLFDFRDRGESGAAIRSAGFFERRDLEAALGFARNRLPGARLGIIGFSMGAVTALQEASEGIRALAVDSPFSSLERLVKERYRRRHLPSRVLFSLADRYNLIVFGYRLSKVSPEQNIRNAGDLPVLFIHGERDSVIPHGHSRRLYEKAVGPKEIWIAEGADHCGAYFLDREEYCRRVSAFFRSYV